MKIISGKWGGQAIPGKSSEKLRPTSDKVKEAIFDQLQARFVDSWEAIRVLDLFAGTGAFGLEALSRGAKKVVFVDHHLQTVRNIEKTLAGFGATEQSEVLCKGALDAIRWLNRRKDEFDLIFIDPPYREDWVQAALVGLQDHSLLARKGLVICEYDKRESITQKVLWKEEGARRYGDTMVSILSPNSL